MPNTAGTIAGGAKSREPALSVVVPATDRPPTLARCLDAIRAAAGPLDEVIVVDESAPLGPAAARNAGVERASRDAIVFVDSDVEVQADALERIRAALGPSSGLDAVFGSYDDQPAVRGIVSLFRNLLHHHVHQSSAGPATTFWAGLGAIRRASFLEVGGFDARRYRRASIEDIDLGVRLASGGGRILLDPMLRGRHLKRWTLSRMVATDFARRGAPWVALRLRTGVGSTDLNLGWRHRLSALACAAAVVAALRRPTAALI
ncbi:MAG TPA: glycosyltransferase family A protein, partial [Thermoleophilaceae bacterium]|nr:glycosyltransferase family A protein [Thermoleophilaceae bacterium]